MKKLLQKCYRTIPPLCRSACILKCCMIFLFVSAFHLNGFSQAGNIHGIVKNQDGDVMPGVSVTVKGKTIGTVTDDQGRYKLDNLVGKETLVFSSIGYKSLEIESHGQNEINATLVPDVAGLDQIVVVGYGTQKRSDLTGAIQSLDASQYDMQSTTNVTEMLNGTVAGFNSNQGTSAEGGGSMGIRGQNSLKASDNPLLVVDGVIFSGVISDINPQDIQTIDILKDASSAAIYGSRSASGVLIITTKRGTVGKPSINFSTKIGITPGFTKTMRPYNAEEYLVNRGINAYQTYGNKPLYYWTNPDHLPNGVTLEEWKNLESNPSNDPVDMWLNRLNMTNIEKKNYLDGKTINWYDEIFHTGVRQDYDLSVSGGTPFVNYYLSGGYTNNKGVILGDEFNVFRSRINLDIKATDFLKIKADINYSNRNHGFTEASLSSAIGGSPYGEIYEDDGSMAWYTNGDITSGNPLIYYTYRDRLNPVQNLYATFSAELSLPFGIKYKASFSNTLRWISDYTFDPLETPNGSNNNGSGSRVNQTIKNWMVDNLFTWDRNLGKKHHLNVTFLYNIEKNQSWYDKQSNSQFSPSDVLSYHALDAGISPSLDDNDEYSTGNALMGRINYSYRNRYLVTLTFRRDGYSAFGKENPYATFPSAAIAWRVSEEPFFNSESVNDLKLRVSWGANGNRSVGIYDALDRLSTTKYLSGSNLVTGIYSSTMANSDLQWESTQAFNLGADFGLWNSRLSGSLDVYLMKTTNLLVDRSLPVIIGYSSVSSNLGELQNRGLELTLNSRNIARAHLSWNTAFNFSFNRNKIKHLYGDMVDVIDDNGKATGKKEADDPTNQWFIGKSIDRIWDYERQGIWQVNEADQAKIYGKTPGDVKLKDQNNDGILTPEDDKVFQGYKQPQYRIGLRNDIHFFDFDFSCFIRADLGFYGNNTLYTTTQWIDRKNILYAPYWTEENPSNEYPKLDANVGSPGFGVWKNRSFIRFQDISLGYNVPGKIIKRYKIQGLKTFVSLRNFFTITKWNNWDPESGETPMPKYITVGVNIAL